VPDKFFGYPRDDVDGGNSVSRFGIGDRTKAEWFGCCQVIMNESNGSSMESLDRVRETNASLLYPMYD
jgi:hypothetical protein